MSQNANAQQARTVTTVDHGKLDLKALTLYAILLAAGFVLNMTVSKFFSGLTGGILSPEFIIAAFCLIAEPVAAVVMALLVSALGNGGAKKVLPLVGTFVVTCISGLIYAVIFVCFVQRNPQLIMVMAPVVAMTGAFNAIIVQALYVPIKKALNK